MTDRLRIAHCADIHLDASGYGQALGADGSAFHRDAFARAIEEMLDHGPNLMLLAGDLFDSNSATAGTIEWAMRTLADLPVPVLMIPGNHDCMEDGAIFHRYDFNRIPNVANLCAPEGEIAHLPKLGVKAWGKGMVEHSRAYSPLGGCPPRPDGCEWYFGMGHGLFVPHGGDTDRSSPIHMAEIEASECDYLGLGHHHAAMELVNESAFAAYSGSPTDKVGRGATYVIVDLAKNQKPTLDVHTVRGR